MNNGPQRRSLETQAVEAIEFLKTSQYDLFFLLKQSISTIRNRANRIAAKDSTRRSVEDWETDFTSGAWEKITQFNYAEGVVFWRYYFTYVNWIALNVARKYWRNQRIARESDFPEHNQLSQNKEDRSLSEYFEKKLYDAIHLQIKIRYQGRKRRAMILYLDSKVDQKVIAQKLCISEASVSAYIKELEGFITNWLTEEKWLENQKGTT